MEHGHGLIWNPNIERAFAPTLDAMIQPTCYVHSSEMPDRIDLRSVIPINDQGPFNSCDGNSVDGCTQGDHLASTGIVVNTSARFAYLAARMKDAEIEQRQVDSNDAGATISGGILAARDIGSVLEDDLPYWKFDWNTGTAESFSPTIPADVLTKAKKHRVQSITPVMWQWADMLPLIATHQAFFSIGIYWSLGSYDGRAPITSYRRAGMGHALAVFEYEWINGERWPRVRNSHGKNWGDGGTCVMRPDVFDYALRCAPWGARGMAGTPAFVKRKIDMIKGALSL